MPRRRGGCSPWRWYWRVARATPRRGRPAWTGRPCATGSIATTPRASPACATGVDRGASRASRPRRTAEQEAELAAVVERGPDPDRDRVVRWRRVDLQALIKARYDVELHERS